MLISLLLVLAGFVALIFGANWLVDGAFGTGKEIPGFRPRNRG